MMDKKDKLNLRSIEVSEKEKFVAHPVRFILTLPLYGIGLYLLYLLGSAPSWGMLLFVIIASLILGFFEWLIYGPINIRTLKQEKQMEALAEYLANKDNGTKKTDIGEKENIGYCHQCGKTVKNNWKICPYCEAVLNYSEIKEQERNVL